MNGAEHLPPVGETIRTRRGKESGDMFEDLIGQLIEIDRTPASEQAIRNFTEACARVDSDPREQQRVRDIADLAETEDLLYDQAVAAAEAGDHERALPLLRRCAEAGVGEADWYLATVLDALEDPEASQWYERAAAEGDTRAADWLASRKIGISADSAAEPETHSPGSADSGPDFASGRIQAVGSSELAAILPILDGCSDDSATSLWSLPCTADLVNISLAPFAFSAGRVLECVRNSPHQKHLVFLMDDSVRELIGAQRKVIKAVQDNADPRADIRALHDRALTARVWNTEASILWNRRFALTGSPQLPPLRMPFGFGLPSLDTRQDTNLSAMPGQTAGDVMLPLTEVPSCDPDTTVNEALERLLGSQAAALLVMDGPSVAGLITLADTARCLHQNRGMPSIQRAETLMRPAVTIPADMPVADAVTAAAPNPSGPLVVTGPDGTAAGYLTLETLLNHSQRDQDQPKEKHRSGLILPGSTDLLQATCL